MQSAPSPCIKVCVLDQAGFCIGCLRTGDEIARWVSMGPAAQWRLLEVLAERKKRVSETGVADAAKVADVSSGLHSGSDGGSEDA
jgi:uncharacterized protein